MKAKLKGKIVSMIRPPPTDRGLNAQPDLVTITLSFAGAVEDVGSKDAKAITLDADIEVKPIVAEKLFYGQELFLTLSTTDPSET